MLQRIHVPTRAPTSYRIMPAVLVGLLAAATGCELQPPTDASDAPTLDQGAFQTASLGEPLPMSSGRDRAMFTVGRALFMREFDAATGSGPLFNAVGCGNCHENPVVGGGGGGEEEDGEEGEGEEGEDIEVHATAWTGGACNDLSHVGGPVFQKQVTDALRDAMGIDLEEPAVEATAVALRTTPDLFGFGLLDAVPDGVILALADPDDRNGDGISGRAHMTADGRVGRFGRKADTPSLDDFNSGAFLMEMGITSPAHMQEQFPGGAPGTAFPDGVDPVPEPEITQEELDAVNDFVRLLAPPPALRLGRSARDGSRTFKSIGCADCHVPALRTGMDAPRGSLGRRSRDRHKHKAFSHIQTVAAYTDLLLHDMGPELADICVGDARPEEFRTEPLMGLRLNSAFLHDGRAESVEEAIMMHGGEATRSRDRFAGLSSRQRSALLRFLESL